MNKEELKEELDQEWPENNEAGLDDEDGEGGNEDFAKLFEESSPKESKFGDRVFIGSIVALDNDVYLMNINRKFEGKLPKEEVPKTLNAVPGTKLPLAFSASRNSLSGANLSLRKAVRIIQI
ncbi:hypothetical protein ACFL6Y_11850 [Elusimicrobiota bacterium]